MRAVAVWLLIVGLITWNGPAVQADPHAIPSQCPSTIAITHSDIKLGTPLMLTANLGIVPTGTNKYYGLWTTPWRQTFDTTVTAYDRRNPSRQFHANFTRKPSLSTTLSVPDLNVTDLGEYRFELRVNDTKCPSICIARLTHPLCPSNIVGASVVTTAADGTQSPVLSASVQMSAPSEQNKLLGKWTNLQTNNTTISEKYSNNDNSQFRHVVALANVTDLGNYTLTLSIDGAVCPHNTTVELKRGTDYCPSRILGSGIERVVLGANSTASMMVEFEFTGNDSNAMAVWKRPNGEPEHFRMGQELVAKDGAYKVSFLKGDATKYTSTLRVTNATAQNVGDYHFRLLLNGERCPQEAIIQLWQNNSIYCPAAIRYVANQTHELNGKKNVTIKMKFVYGGNDSAARVEWMLPSGLEQKFAMGNWQNRVGRMFNVTFWADARNRTRYMSTLSLPNGNETDVGKYRFRLVVDGKPCAKEAVVYVSKKSGKSGASVAALGSVVLAMTLAVVAAWA